MPLTPGLEERYITLLYQHLLGRDPEPAVLPQWVNYLTHVGPLATVKAIARSEEAKHHAVSKLYEDVLNREGDPVGLISWAQSKYTAAEIRELFLASDEYLGNVEPEPAPPVKPPEPTPPALSAPKV